MTRLRGPDIDTRDENVSAFQRAIDEGMAQIVEQVLDSLGEIIVSDASEHSVSPDDLDGIPSLWQLFVSVTLMPLLLRMMVSESNTVSALAWSALGISVSPINETVATDLYLAQARNRLVGIGDQLWENARDQLNEGIAAGEDMGQLAARVRDAADVTGPRAHTIAQTEVIGAHNAANIATIRRMGVATTKEWLHTPDDRVRDTHEAAGGQVVGLNETFQVGNASLDHPGDPDGPPEEVINCRCTMAYTVDDSIDMTGDVIEITDDTLTASKEDNMTDDDKRRTRKWSGVLVVEGTPTGDGRQFADNALTWPDAQQSGSLELPLRWQRVGAHGGYSDETVAVGRIDTIERRGNELHATGVFDLESEYGAEAARMMGTREDPGFLAGVSIDADNPDDPAGTEIEYVYPSECEDLDWDDWDAVEETGASCFIPELMIFHSGRIRAATLVDIPAYVEARLYLDEEVEEEDDSSEAPVSGVLQASAHTIELPDIPPAAWFAEPTQHPAIGAITVTDEGQIFGYLARKGVAHRGYRDQRIEVPMGTVDYGVWMTRERIVEADDGTFTKIDTGPITMNCGHAPATPKLRGKARTEHYDNSCSVVATVRVGENKHGVWIAGALLPDVSGEQVTRMMSCQLSGDWGPSRERHGGFTQELNGALLVPVPGFPSRAAYQSVTVRNGLLSRSVTPVRFASRVPQADRNPIGTKQAVDRLAVQVLAVQRADKTAAMARTVGV